MERIGGNRKPKLNSDIMNILFTENEIKYLMSKECQNRSDVREMRNNFIEMVELVDKLPPNAKLNLRNDLLRKMTPSYKGGGSGSIDLKTKAVLENRNLRTYNDVIDTGDKSLESAKHNRVDREGKNISVGMQVDNVDNSDVSAKNFIVDREGFNSGKVKYENKKLISENEEVEDYTKILGNSKFYCEKKFEGQRFEIEDVLNNELEEKTKNILSYGRDEFMLDKDIGDMKIGEEKVWEPELKSWAQSNENYVEKKIRN